MAQFPNKFAEIAGPLKPNIGQLGNAALINPKVARPHPLSAVDSSAHEPEPPAVRVV